MDFYLHATFYFGDNSLGLAALLQVVAGCRISCNGHLFAAGEVRFESL